MNASGVVRTPKGGAVHRIPRFPPLADQVWNISFDEGNVSYAPEYTPRHI